MRRRTDARERRPAHANTTYIHTKFTMIHFLLIGRRESSTTTEFPMRGVAQTYFRYSLVTATAANRKVSCARNERNLE